MEIHEVVQQQDQEVVEDEQYSFDAQISQSILGRSTSTDEMDELQSQETSTIIAEEVHDEATQQDEQDERVEVDEMHELQGHQMHMDPDEHEEHERQDQHQLAVAVAVVLDSIK